MGISTRKTGKLTKILSLRERERERLGEEGKRGVSINVSFSP